MKQIQVINLAPDAWDRPRVQSIASGAIYADISLGRGEWHTTVEETGEPIAPIRDVEFVYAEGDDYPGRRDSSMSAFERIKRSDGPVEVTEDDYWYALEVLPPIYLHGRSRGGFAMGEALTSNGHNEPVYYCFTKQADKYFGCKGTIEEAREIFKRDLRQQIRA